MSRSHLQQNVVNHISNRKNFEPRILFQHMDPMAYKTVSEIFKKRPDSKIYFVADNLPVSSSFADNKRVWSHPVLNAPKIKYHIQCVGFIDNKLQVRVKCHDLRTHDLYQNFGCYKHYVFIGLTISGASPIRRFALERVPGESGFNINDLDVEYLIQIPINHEALKVEKTLLTTFYKTMADLDINYNVVNSDAGNDFVTLVLADEDSVLNFIQKRDKFKGLEYIYGCNSTISDAQAYRLRAPAKTILQMFKMMGPETEALFIARNHIILRNSLTTWEDVKGLLLNVHIGRTNEAQISHWVYNFDAKDFVEVQDGNDIDRHKIRVSGLPASIRMSNVYKYLFALFEDLLSSKPDIKDINRQTTIKKDIIRGTEALVVEFNNITQPELIINMIGHKLIVNCISYMLSFSEYKLPRIPEIIPKNATEISASLKTYVLKSGAELVFTKNNFGLDIVEATIDLFSEMSIRHRTTCLETSGPAGKKVLFASLSGDIIYAYTGVNLASVRWSLFPEWLSLVYKAAESLFEDFEPNGVLISILPYASSFIPRHFDNVNETKQKDTVVNVVLGSERRVYFPEDNIFFVSKHALSYGWNLTSPKLQPLHSVPADGKPHSRPRVTFSFRQFLDPGNPTESPPKAKEPNPEILKMKSPAKPNPGETTPVRTFHAAPKAATRSRSGNRNRKQ